MGRMPGNEHEAITSAAEYWKSYWNQHEVVATGCPQADVGRTRNGIPITEERWEQTVEYIASLVKITPQASLIELCCANGLLLGPLAKRCAHAVGVDFSDELLQNAQSAFPGVFTTVNCDVLAVELPRSSADIVIIYFAIQHFEQKDAVRLIERAITFLKPGGRLLVGDVPDAGKLWGYLSTPEYRSDYIRRIVGSCPMIGTWFDREFFEAVGDYVGGVDVKIFDQPENLINANVRFDVLYTRHLV